MPPSLQQRKEAFVQLGKVCTRLAGSTTWPGFESGMTEDEFDSFQALIDTQFQYNGWFTAENIRMALRSWGQALSENNIDKWLEPYFNESDAPFSQRNIALICAGNIPMVGFHDVLSVLISGHKAIIKLSSDDQFLIPALLQSLVKFEPSFSDSFRFSENKLTEFDAVIATGSNNSSRYFDYYFRHVPNIIRRNRTSVAIISGNENAVELQRAGHDIFDYFGLGCRNVTKVYVPAGYKLDTLFEAIYSFHPIINHNKYANNYDYNKAVWLLNKEDLLDNGFILFKQDSSLASPTASLYYEYYRDEKQLRAELEQKKEEIQCIIGQKDIPFGQSQYPELWDYADGADTIRFLRSLK